MNSVLYHQFTQRFKAHSLIGKDEIARFFLEFEPGLNDATVTWRIYDLRERNIIRDVKKGLYQLNNKQDFFPEPDADTLAIADLIKREYDPQFYTVWDTIHLNNLTELQVVKTFIVLEVEKGYTESVFFALKREGFNDVFVNPDGKEIELYVSDADHPVIIKSFLGRAPVQVINQTILPALEKILVDLYCDKDIYYPWQGDQLRQVYRNATMKYNLNFTKLLNYANRRHRGEDIKKILLETVPTELQTIIA